MRASAVFIPRNESINSSNASKSQNECSEVANNIRKVTQLRGLSLSSNNLHNTTDLQKSKPSNIIQLARSNSTPAAISSPPPEVKLSSLDKDKGGTPERRVIADDVKMIHSKLKEVLDENNKHDRKAINVLETGLEPVLKEYEGPNGHLSYQDTKQIHVAFKKLSKQLPKGELKELCTILAQHTKCDWMQMKHEKLQAKQLGEYLALGKPGAGKATTYSAGVNAGASLL